MEPRADSFAGWTAAAAPGSACLRVSDNHGGEKGAGLHETGAGPFGAAAYERLPKEPPVLHWESREEIHA